MIGLVGYVFVPTAPPRMFPASASSTASAPRRPRRARREPVCRDAEPARRRRADRRRRALRASAGTGGRRPSGRLWPVVGLVRGDGDRRTTSGSTASPGSSSRSLVDRRSSTTAPPLACAARRRNRPPVDPQAGLRRHALDGPEHADAEPTAIKHGYTTGARALATPLGHRARPHAGHAERAHGRGRARSASPPSVLVPFENRERAPLLLARRARVFVVGSILDILDGALARAGGKSTPFGAFIDSTTDRVGEGFMLAAIALVFARDGNDPAVVASRSPPSPARSSSRTRARRRRRSACAATSASAHAPSASSSSPPASSSRRGACCRGRSYLLAAHRVAHRRPARPARPQATS